jgi:hypothetical protein
MARNLRQRLRQIRGLYGTALRRNSVNGKWAGAFGNDQAISGTWRDGYLELTFSGEWRDSPKSTPIGAAAVLAGWIDGDSAAGRMTVEGRADGPWTALREVTQ